ncbi:MAG: tRNA uridine-5-carboxymethylaminomethyl(34) synthesis GTPase MnmE [Desulfatibacillum sp.]|nr:tRNA uridine-5-carboxymethylaminomethyl(34) synthesis GTPase MnmE [Desulfatibacillum sp.]
MNPSQTIAAVATPPGVGGIGIVRISGSQSLSILRQLFFPMIANSRNCFQDSPFRLIRGRIAHPESMEIVDEVLAVFMPGPRTYTGEDVVEIQGHGGPVVLGRVLELVLDRGARLAQPGEFTRRAFLNNRMDLSQAEAVVDLIHARTATAARIAAAHTGGALGARVRGILDSVYQCRTLLEAALDFGEDTGEGDVSRIIGIMDHSILPGLEELAANAELGKAYLRGISVAIVGRPNVGKSSLMNALADEDRSIVTDVPGTTRDVVREPVLIRGFNFILSDTAGLRTSSDKVEQVGIRKTREAMDAADLIVLVAEAGEGFTEEDIDLLAQAREACSRVILVFNKMDLCPTYELPSIFGENTPFLCTSARTGEGLDQLRQAMECAAHGPGSVEQIPELVPNLRQKQALETALDGIGSARDRVSEMAWELAAVDLDIAQKSLEEILGIGASPDILDAIFAGFCIGK